MTDEARVFVAANRELWDAWADLHVGSDFYDVAGFLSDPGSSPLDPVVRDVLGDISGKRVLHLQCHFGMDTLRLALMGATVTGVDFSSKAIAAARQLASAAGIPATFVQSDVSQLSDEVPSDGFDVIFTSHGAITWLPDLRPWARGIAGRLVPGGVFHVVDMHPTLWMIDEEAEERPPKIRYSYFSRGVFPFQERGTYAVPDADIEATSFSWQHTFEDVLGSLIDAGLAIEALREYPCIAWKYMPDLREGADGMWRLPPEAGDIPLMFSVTARRATHPE